MPNILVLALKIVNYSKNWSLIWILIYFMEIQIVMDAVEQAVFSQTIKSAKFSSMPL